VPETVTGVRQHLVAYATDYRAQAYEATPTDLVPIPALPKTRGFFTAALLDGLWGAAVDEQGVVTSASLTAHLATQVPLIATRFRRTQLPRFEDGTGGGAPLIFGGPRVPPNVIFRFSAKRNGPIALKDGLDNTLYEGPAADPGWNRRLTKGLYSLVDLATGEDLLFKVKPAGEDIHVDF
jgi:hypothetical protein